MRITALGVLVLVGGALLCPSAALSGPQSDQSTTSNQPPTASPPAPLTLDEVLRLLKENKQDERSAASTISARGVGFELEAPTEKKLRKAGANDDLMAQIWQATPTGKAHMRAVLTTPTGVVLQASAGETFALNDIQTEKSADARIRLVEAFEKKFPDSPLLSYVDAEGAKADQEKGNYPEAVSYGRKSLKLDPDNTFSLVIMALVLPQPRTAASTTEIPAMLSEAAADANRALILLPKLLARPDETDDHFRARKDSLAADAHFALGMVAMQLDQFHKAAEEYQSAVASTTKPTFQYYYRLAEAEASEGEISEAIGSLRKASELARGTAMQKYADDFIVELQQKPH